MFMKLALLATLLSAAYAQYPCVYNDGNYTLNLTNQSGWTLELETAQTGFFYYTPCRNGIQCYQGNADYYCNAAQYAPGANQCVHYLSVDHHDHPSYLFYAAAWMFQYQDGETCDITQQPRTTTMYFHCNEEVHTPLALYDVNEPTPCNYVVDLRGNEACVPESTHNANCQWRTPNGTGGYYFLDLSALNNMTLYSRLPNGYYHTITPCRNEVYCYQQYPHPVMAVIDNHETGTCEHYGAVWEDGRVQPALHNVGTSGEHWSFHYYNGEMCSNGAEGEEELRFYCDPTVETAQVMNTTGENCHFYINIATQYACTSTADKMLPSNFNRIAGKAKQLTADTKNMAKNIKARFGKFFNGLKN